MPDGEDPRAVVNLLLECGDELGLSFTNLALQKLLYFAHASFLVETKRPLISGVFEAWEHGPVCRVVYDALKGYGRSPVTAPISKRDVFTNEQSEIAIPQSRQVTAHVFGVAKTLGRLSPSQLRNLSHIPNGPWDIIWNKAETSVTFGNRIPDSLIASNHRILPQPNQAAKKGYDGYEATPFAGD